MMRIIIVGLLLSIIQASYSQERQLPSEKPSLVVGIVVSGMRYDYLNRYWDKFGEGGFKRIMSKGTNCKNVHHDYLITEPGSGAASIVTGAYPDVHGIVSDYWYDRLRNKVIYCIDDENVKTLGGKFGEEGLSPRHLQISTLPDELRLSGKFQSKVFSIGLDPKISLLSGGHSSNGTFWYDIQSGKWVSSTYFSDDLPGWVNDFNDKNIAALYLGKIWETLFPLEQYTSSIEDNSEHEQGFEGKKIFPYDLSIMSARKRQQPNFDILKYTPFGNTYTKDFAISTIVEEKLGKDEFTDWLSVNFASTSYLGELYSSWSVEMEDMYLRLDQDIEHFLTFIDSEIGLKNVLIYVTADNAAANAPSFMLEKRMPSGYFNYNSAISLLKTYLNVIYGTGDWVSFYYAQQIFLNRELIEDSKLSISEFQDRVVRFMIQFEGVSNALSADDLIRNNYTHGTFEMMQKSYSQKRSGDILLRLNPGWVEKGIERQYASTYHYDSHVPLIWYGWKIGREEISRKLSVTDIVPTIASFLNISRPPAVQGNVIGELLD